MLKQTVAPTTESIEAILSLEDAKEFANIVGAHDDKVMSDLIKAAINDAEDITNRQFASATYELTLPKFTQNMRLPKNPIQGVSKIEYMDQDGNYQTLETANYFFYEELEVGTLVFENLPGLKVHPQAVKITFTSGYETADKFPAMLRQWLKVRVNTLYEHREELVLGTISTKLGHVDSVLDRYRIRSM
ncbi:head-tail connector protein [Arcobacter roscoffensis]|uniref:Phage head-tail connector protein n=1 Tax=Arcobacter roscoffensis TaxID=2961520 RepID=A0ABY5E1G6_9BACT|nr:phage head-tail connector protein [Arcobacter roscoffensis]UTJ05394.1 phage head-tail connector protein [Arcobacter roscoffensis]